MQHQFSGTTQLVAARICMSNTLLESGTRTLKTKTGAANGLHVFVKSASRFRCEGGKREALDENMKLQLATDAVGQAKGGSVTPLALSMGVS